ncbi:hypothetical protein HPB49_018260 [Dermacentor silvarum]|uniref:Uncharacterized protein n=1 Tax=Dermacentor silvarum TaxID=543639 RepID=A0ACB8CZ32_DERSI|nr:hypothetical protein HPB49_018260 [Dermacentor silvarum]
MEHMPKLLAEVCPDSNTAKMASGRTNATAIVNNVTGCESKEVLGNLPRNSKFSLTLEEATDSSCCCKHLCFLTRVFDGKRVMAAFFDLILHRLSVEGSPPEGHEMTEASEEEKILAEG